MSLDLSSALRDVAEHAPVGTLELPGSAVGSGGVAPDRRRHAPRSGWGWLRRSPSSRRRRQAPWTASVLPSARTDAVRRRESGPHAAAGLPADQVATVLPAADPAAGPGECGWTVQRPSVESGPDIGVSFGSYAEQAHGSLAVQYPRAAVRRGDVVGGGPAGRRARRGGRGGRGGRRCSVGSSSGGVWRGGPGLVACGGPDALKALPDGRTRCTRWSRTRQPVPSAR